MGLFDRFRKKGTDKVDVLRYLSEIKDSELQELINFVKNDPDYMNKVEENPDLMKYLSLVSSVLGHNTLAVTQGIRDRDYFYKIYDEMDESTAYITAALDILSDDATQPDDRGRILVVESESQKVVSLLENMLDELEIEAKISRWTRSVAKYGDLFIKIGAEEGAGIVSIDDTIYPSSVDRVDYKGKTLAFLDREDSLGQYSRDYLPPWDYVHFRHKGEVRREDRSLVGSPDGTASKFSAVYGQSALKAAIKVYSQLRFVENLLILSRLTNSIRRNIFLINVGNLDPGNAFESVRNYANLLKKSINLDIDENVFNSKKHTVTYDEDIFLPVQDTKNDVRIEQIGGDVNIGEQYDLEYLLNKLFSALKIPKAYLNYEQDLNARSTLIQLDIRYARSVAQLQNTMLTGLDRLARIHLAYNGLNPDAVDFTLKLTAVSAIDAEARLEARSQKIDAASDMWDLLTTINNGLTDIRDTGETDATSVGGGGPDFDIDLGDIGGPDDTPDIPDAEPAEAPARADTGGDEESYADFSRETTESIKLGEQVFKSGGFSVPSSSPIDLAYAAEIILRDYLGFDGEEVNTLLRIQDDMRESAQITKLHESNKIKRRYTRDLNSSYPDDSGMEEFDITVSRLRELTESEDGSKTN